MEDFNSEAYYITGEASINISTYEQGTKQCSVASQNMMRENEYVQDEVNVIHTLHKELSFERRGI